MPDPGWFADPADPELNRRWDGSGWTDETRPRTVEDDPAAPDTADPASAGPEQAGPEQAAPAPSEPAPFIPTLPPPSAVAPAPTTAGQWTAAPPRSAGAARPSKRSVWPKIVFGLCAVAVLAGATIGGWRLYQSADDDFSRAGTVLNEGDGDGSAPLDAVTAALGERGVACGPPSPALGRPELRATVKLIRDTLADVTADLGADVPSVRAVDEFERQVNRLNVSKNYSAVSCGFSTVLADGDTARLAFFHGERPTAVQAVAGLGLRFVSIAPPPMDTVVERIERTGETCPGSERTTSKQVLLAELLPKLQPGPDGTTPAAATAQRLAIQSLPDVDVVVRNCSDSQILGTDTSARVVVLGQGSTSTQARLLAEGPLAVVGP